MKRSGKWTIGIAITTVVALATLTTAVDPQKEGRSSQVQNDSPTVENIPCSYQWGYQEAPELSAEFDAAIKALYPLASARVEIFGENCVRSDGSSSFLAKETDFYVKVQVDHLSDTTALGNWIIAVMEIVAEIPREQLATQMGFVDFRFEKTEAEFRALRVPIDGYLKDGTGKSGSEVFDLFGK